MDEITSNVVLNLHKTLHQLGRRGDIFWTTTPRVPCTTWPWARFWKHLNYVQCEYHKKAFTCFQKNSFKIPKQLEDLYFIQKGLLMMKGYFCLFVCREGIVLNLTFLSCLKTGKLGMILKVIIIFRKKWLLLFRNNICQIHNSFHLWPGLHTACISSSLYPGA